MSFRRNAPAAKQRWGLLWVAVATLSLVIGTMAVYGASLTGSNFEIDTDANLVVNNAAPSIDWLAGASGTDMRTGVVVKADALSGTGDNSFGQGSKEDTAVPSVVSGSIPPNKSDLKNFGVYTESTASGDFLNLFWSRVQDPSGTTNMDFEFNHNACVVGGTDNVCSGNGVTPVRTEGDLLIQYDLSNGGVNADISKREWTGSAWGPATDLGSDAIGTINTTAIPAAASGGIGSLSPRTFGEASIDLASLFEEDECEAFGSAYLKSRSSDTFNSALKDFIAPAAVNVTNCGSITIVKDAQPNDAQNFGYTGDLGAFTLDDDSDSTFSNQKEFSGLTAGDYDITESAVTGWTLDDIDCGTADVDVSGSTVTVHLAAKQNVTCTFTNIQDTFKILVLTCTSDGALVNSSLELDDDADASTGTSADTALGVSESDICDLAQFSGVTQGAHKVDVGVNTP